MAFYNRPVPAMIGYRDLKLDWDKVADFVKEWSQRKGARSGRYELTLPCLVDGQKMEAICLCTKGRHFIMELAPFCVSPEPFLYHYFAVIEKNGQFHLDPKVFIMGCSSRTTHAQRDAAIKPYF